MNEVLSFFQDVFSGSNNSTKPVGLSSFKAEENKKNIIKKNNKHEEIKISDLMRKPH